MVVVVDLDLDVVEIVDGNRDLDLDATTLTIRPSWGFALSASIEHKMRARQR